jgi:hypothetical protein
MSTPAEEPGRALLDAWASHHAPPSTIEARTWEAVQTRAARGELGPELAPEAGASVSASPALAGGARLIAILGGVSALALAVGLGLLLARPEPASTSLEPRAAAEAAEIETEAEERSSAEGVPADPESSSGAALSSSSAEGEPQAAPGPELASAASPEPSRPASAASTHGRRSVPESEPAARSTSAPPGPATDDPADDLAAEMELLGAARTALKTGDTKAALAKLDAHARRFPHGALASDRELSRVTVLCKVGDLDAAERVARSYADAHPGAAQTKRLHKTCVGDRL